MIESDLDTSLHERVQPLQVAQAKSKHLACGAMLSWLARCSAGAALAYMGRLGPT
jgi:hypothetical protein